MLLLSCISCNKEDVVKDFDSSSLEGDRVTVGFNVAHGGFSVATLRADDNIRYDYRPSSSIDDVKLNSLQLWVFDEDHIFVECVDAELISTSDQVGSDNKTITQKKYTYKAKLQKSDRPRYIHLVGNYKATSEDVQQWKNRSEYDLVPSIRLTKPEDMPMWARIKVDRIKEGESFPLTSLKLSVCKFEIVVSDVAKFDKQKLAYALYNTRKEGSLALFDGKDFSDGGVISEVQDSAKVKSWRDIKDENMTPVHKPIYLFEQSNSLTHSNVIPYAILKVYVKEQQRILYYKLDLVKRSPLPGTNEHFSALTEEDRIQLKRGTYPFINITYAMDLTSGNSTIAGAVQSQPANNIIFSQEAMESTYITDNANEVALQVWRTLIIVPASVFDPSKGELNGKQDCWVKIFKFGETPVPSNTQKRIASVSVLGGENNPLIESVETIFDDVTGASKMRVKFKHFDEQTLKETPYLTGSIIVHGKAMSDGDFSRLAKVVRFVATRSYTKGEFNFRYKRQRPEGKLKRGDKVDISFTIPEDFNPDILPLTVKFYTKDLTPAPGQDMRTVISQHYYDGYQLYYNYIIREIPANRTIKKTFIVTQDQIPEEGLSVKYDAQPFGFIIEDELKIK